MAPRGKAAATTALVPFECPQCARDYRVELDFVKMRRLNRIAVCPTCQGRYSLSVRLERSAAPFDPDPYADERHSSVRPVRDGRPGRTSDAPAGTSREDEPPDRRAETEPTARVPRGRQDTEPDDRPPFVVDDSVPPPSDPPLSDRKPKRKLGPRYERTLDGVGEPKQAGRQDTEPGVGVHVIVEVGLVDRPHSRKTTRSYRPEHLVTLPGLGVPKRSIGD